MLPATYESMGAEIKRNDSFLWHATFEDPRAYPRNSYFNIADAWLIGRKTSRFGITEKTYMVKEALN